MLVEVNYWNIVAYKDVKFTKIEEKKKNQYAFLLYVLNRKPQFKDIKFHNSNSKSLSKP